MGKRSVSPCFFVQKGDCLKDFGSFFKTVDGNEGGKCQYPTRLDTYGCGCQHDCSYCYAKSLLDFRNLWNAQAPAVANIADISREIRKLPRESIVRLGGMTDCFQPMEKLHKNTYKTIRLLNRRKVGYLIVTKSALVADDDYISIMDKDLAHIQITITCFDDDLYRRLSYEKASPPSERIKAVEKLQRAGFDVAVRLSPFIQEFVDFDTLNNIACDKIIVEFLRVNTWIKKWFDIDYSEYTVKQGGYRHLPLSKKVERIKQITGFKEISVCEDEDKAFEYWKNHFNPNREDCCNLRGRA